MKIKKPMSAGGGAAEGATGGATIADRFKLDVITAGANKGSGVSKGAVAAAFGAALVSLVLAGALAATLYMHWEYLSAV